MRPRSMPLAMLTMQKAFHGFLFLCMHVVLFLYLWCSASSRQNPAINHSDRTVTIILELALALSWLFSITFFTLVISNMVSCICLVRKHHGRRSEDWAPCMQLQIDSQPDYYWRGTFERTYHSKISCNEFKSVKFTTNSSKFWINKEHCKNNLLVEFKVKQSKRHRTDKGLSPALPASSELKLFDLSSFKFRVIIRKKYGVLLC